MRIQATAPVRKSNKRLPGFLALTALTLVTGGLSAMGFRALRGTRRISPVDALSDYGMRNVDCGSNEQPSTNPQSEWPCVSVIVPARNEARNLPRLLPSLLSQRYPDYEVIVVDDRSTDATPQILDEWARRDHRLQVVKGAPLPESGDWRGKPYALYQGVAGSKGEWLLFTDADTVHRPLALSSTVAFAMKEGVDLLSILPQSELGTPIERIVMPVAFIGIANLYPPYRVNNPKDRTAIANGQFILIRRDVYDRVGGIKRVNDQVVEDLEFARVVKGEGYRLYLADGRHLVSVRMYTSFAEIWEGWTKNTVLSFRGKPGLALFAIVGLLSLNCLPPALTALAVRAWRSATSNRSTMDSIAALWLTGLASWHILMPFFYRRRVDKLMGLPGAWALTQPLGVAIMMLIMFNSLVRLLSGRGVTWKGRTYQG